MNKIEFTLSKILAYVLIALAVIIDFNITHSAATFMYTVPFSVSLILAKQGQELINNHILKNNNEK